MQVEFKTDELVPCRCGFKPDHFTIGYGRTPYDVFCPVCKKQSVHAKCKVTNHHENAIDYWNKIVSKMTVEEINDELIALRKEKKEIDPYNEYKVYTYYWIKDEGEKLIKKC